MVGGGGMLFEYLNETNNIIIVYEIMFHEYSMFYLIDSLTM